MKVKVAVLNYMHGLAALMDPSDFINYGESRLAVSRIITWTTEPKSVDVRKASQAVLIALFNLNTPELSILLQALPKTFQVRIVLRGRVKERDFHKSAQVPL